MILLYGLWLVIGILSGANAIWPFPQKRFTAEAFIDAGPLGLDEVKGRVVALGDWNGDQKLDLFTLGEDRRSVQVYLWNHDLFKYVQGDSLTSAKTIVNVIPADFNHDGRLDLLVMHDEEQGGWWGGQTERISMEVFLGKADGTFDTTPWTLPMSTDAQPVLFDADGSLRPSLLGWHPSNSGSTTNLGTWLNINGSGLSAGSTPLQNPGQACQLANPHSSAFVDIDGDCLPDLVLHCERSQSDIHYIQIWLNKGDAGFVLARSYDLPSGAGPLSFADMNRDGAIDIVFPTCSRYSTSTGVCQGATINIAYNKQVPICSSVGPQMITESEGSTTLKCRGWGELCTSDDNFGFSFSAGDPSFVSVAFSSLWHQDTPNLLMSVPSAAYIPLPIRPGDFNLDGFPDLLFTISNDTASPHGVFGSGRGSQARILENVPCGRGVAGCTTRSGRGLKVGSGKGWDVLDSLYDVQGASWIDIDDDGTLDILVQRSGSQDGPMTTFIQNNFYQDAFFLKAQLLNGACEKDCEPTAKGKKYSPLGVSYSGATYKFTVLDSLGRRAAQQSAQLPQTGYHALGTPYSYIGLGRTNNYVERLFIGSSLHGPLHSTYIESLVPNSQVIINPPFPVPVEGPPPDSPVKTRSQGWRSELFLHPGDWVPWVGAAVLGTVIILGFVVIGLNEREKREDEKERRRALHAINFQAL